MLFKEKLVILRKSRSLTQDEFASAVGVSRQAVYKWESGQSYPEVPKLLEMKSLLGISIDDLLDDSFDIPLPEKKKRRRRKKAAEAEAAVAAPAVEEVKAEEPAPVVEEPKVEEVKVEEPAAAVEAPVVEEIKAEEPAPVAKPAPKKKAAKKAPVKDTDNGFEVEEAPDIDMPGHVSMPKFKDVNLEARKKLAEAQEKRNSFFAKFFGSKK